MKTDQKINEILISYKSNFDKQERKNIIFFFGFLLPHVES